MTYKQARIKTMLEEILMFPFVLLGRIYGRVFPLKTKHDIFLFFPNADIGGSPKVNIDITHAVKDKKPLIIFSKKPQNNGFKELFTIEGVRIIDLHKRIDNKTLHFINFFYRGVIASWVNKSQKPVIFGGECIFFYKMLAHVSKKVKRVELCHLNTWLPYSIAHAHRIDLRIFSTDYLRREVVAQYKEQGVYEKLNAKLRFIDNAIPIPQLKQVNNGLLEVVFIGRGSPQKRVPLVAAIATAMHQAGDSVHFSFVGDVSEVIDITALPFATFYGNVQDQQMMDSIYEKSDVLIMTSAFEGLPIVVMKMMAYGKVVVSTAVNGIPDYIHHMENGLLIKSMEEDNIIQEGITHLRTLINDPNLKIKLGNRSHVIAKERFSEEVFTKTYRSILIR